ncbi:MAG: acyloxyacyl hydrolase [Thermoanaerobaculia bacterium]
MRSRKLLAFSQILVFALLSGLLSSRPVHAVEPRSFSVSAGSFNIFDPDVRAEAGVEAGCAPFRLGWLPRWFPPLSPAAGGMVNSKGSFYVYAGLRADLPLAAPWELSIQFAPGVYRAGNGFDLGGPVEFRSGIELSYPLAPRGRIGLLLFHLSNAGLYTHNPGSESLVLTYRYRL